MNSCIDGRLSTKTFHNLLATFIMKEFENNDFFFNFPLKVIPTLNTIPSAG